MRKSVRDVVTGELSLEYFARRLNEGWKLASIEWTRESDTAAEVGQEPGKLLDVQAQPPYGFQVREDGAIQECAPEAAVLLLALEQIVRERSVPEIASDLNSRGYLTRSGLAWTASSVFDLLPRLIEAGPSLLKSEAWQQRRVSEPRIADSIQ
jgi:hypothetical protein